ncbi:hypothetical protein, partial [Paraburkholderia elongata]|uniref:hypothetical protein n=1 Tax=Paraburkholderia elongata TaxID=2675747 RepID=UPI001C12F4C0
VCRYWPSASTSDIVVAEEHVNRRDSPGQLEQWFQGVRPDFTVDLTEHRLIVEVAVTHFCDAQKQAKLKLLGFPALEIDLSNVARDIRVAEVRRLVLEETEGKRWIFYPGEAEARATLEVRRSHEESLRVAALEREREAERVRDRARAAVYENKVALANRRFLESREITKENYVASKFGISQRDWPPLLDASVRDERSIETPRRIWQADVYRKFIHGKLVSRGIALVSVAKVADGLTRRYPIAPASFSMVPISVWVFFCSLERQGYLQQHGGQEFAVLKDTLPVKKSPRVQARRGQRLQRGSAPVWARDMVDASQIWSAAKRTGIHIPPAAISGLLHVGRGNLTEERYARNVAATLNVSVQSAREFLCAVGFFAKVEPTRV